MKHVFLISGFVLALFGCATGQGGSHSGTHALPWPTGQYRLEGSVEYRRDALSGERLETEEYWGELTIGDDGAMHLSSSSGICMERSPRQVARDRELRQRTFPCNEATYVLEPMADGIRGELQARVSQTFRVRGGCIAYQDGNRNACVAWQWDLRETVSIKTGRLRAWRLEAPGGRPGRWR